MLIEQTSRDVPVLRTSIGSDATRVVVRPGDSFRFVDDAGRIAKAPGLRVRRLDNNLIVDGFPDGQVVELNNFFGACRPGAECTVALESLGAPAGTVITEETLPMGALADGSFLLYSTGSDSQAAAALPLLSAAAQSGGPSAGVIGAVGGGLLLAGAAGAAGGGGDPPAADTTPPAGLVITSKRLTNDRTPPITGEAEAGARITLRIDVNGNGAFTDTGDATFVTTADSNGRWSIDTGTAPQSGALPSGGLLDAATYAILVQAADAAGNVSPSIRSTIAIDTTPPPLPVIGIVEADDVVNAVERADGVVITGNAEAGAAVRVAWGTSTVTTTATAADTYSAAFTVAQVPPDGTTQVAVVATDAAGNESVLATRGVLIDATPPVAPTITSAAATNLTRPTIGGIAEAGSRVTLSIDAAGDGSVDATYVATAAANGTWSVNLATATPTSGSIGAGLVNGSTNGLSASALDAAANASGATVATLRIDTSIPAAPMIASVETDNVVNIAERADGVVVSGTIGEAARPVTVVWGTTTRVVTAVGTGWTVAFTAAEVPPEGLSTVRASYVNAAGTPSAEGTRDVAIDLTAPAGPVIGDSVPGATATGPITFTFAFAEPIIGFVAGDVQIAGGTAGAFAGTSATYTLLVNPTPDITGTVTVTVPAGTATDAAGNPTTSDTSGSQAFDMVVPPTVVISGTTGGTASGPLTFTFTFSEPVTGFTATDIATTATVSGFSQAPGSPNQYTALLTPPSGSGTFTVDVAAGAAQDLAGNNNVAAAQSAQAYAPADTTAPTLLISDDVAGVANGTIRFAFAWSEPVFGFTYPADFTVGSAGTGVFGPLQSSGASSYTLEYTPALNQTGTLSLVVVASAVTDAAGNAYAGPSPAYLQAYDRVAPFFTLPVSDDVPGTASGPVIFTFYLNEAVSGFDAADVTVFGGTITSGPVPGADLTYTMTVNPGFGDGSITVEVPASPDSFFTDAANNSNAVGASHSQAYSRNPAVSGTPQLLDNGPTNAGPDTPYVSGAGNDTTPRFTFNLSSVLLSTDTLVLQRGALTLAPTVTGTTVSFQEPTALASGSYTYAASISDGLGTTLTLDLLPDFPATGYTFVVV
jgi:hypothetical protein